MLISTFSENRTVVALQQLYMRVLGVTLSVGDVGPTEYTILALIHDHGASVSVKKLKALFGVDDDLDTFLDQLAKKELIERVRDAQDRRGFAVKSTSKGKQRIALLDEAVSAELIACNPRITERSFLRLAHIMHEMSGCMYGGGDSSLIFTGAALLFMNVYHKQVLKDSSYYGMTSLQMAILCMFDHAGIFHVDRMGDILSPSSDVIGYQLQALGEGGFVADDADVEVTQKGLQRLAGFSKRLDSSMRRALADQSPDTVQTMRDFCECCAYLFA